MSGAKVLCIDDDEGTLDLLKEELEEAGYVVRLAADGQSGLESALRDAPDAIVCDIAMPVLSGWEVRARLNEADARFKEIPFIYLSAYDDRETILRARRLGADDHLSKPIDFELLGAILEQHLSRRTGGDARCVRRLTAREIETLTWTARGKSSAEIARILDVSERTVNFHIENACDRLNVVNRTQAAVKATLLRIIAP